MSCLSICFMGKEEVLSLGSMVELDILCWKAGYMGRLLDWFKVGRLVGYSLSSLAVLSSYILVWVEEGSMGWVEEMFMGWVDERLMGCEEQYFILLLGFGFEAPAVVFSMGLVV